jgi:hypothetical protein
MFRSTGRHDRAKDTVSQGHPEGSDAREGLRDAVTFLRGNLKPELPDSEGFGDLGADEVGERRAGRPSGEFRDQ